MTGEDRSLPERLTALYVQLDRRLHSIHTATSAETATAITTAAVDLIPAVENASITEHRYAGGTETGEPRARTFSTLTATDDTASRNDDLQQRLATGPSIDALIHGAAYRTGNLAHDPRWPRLGPNAGAGDSSVLSLRLAPEPQPDRAMNAGRTTALTLYSVHPDAFDESTQLLATVLAAHTTHTLAAATARTKTANLERALTSSREIGMAMGVLMATHKITRNDAFTRLRVASQHTNRRLADIARDVTETGILDDTPAKFDPVTTDV